MAFEQPMKLLVDTCALLALSNNTLTRSGRKHLASGEDALISPIVVWEIAIKVKSGKIHIPDQPQAWVEKLAERHSLTMHPAGIETSVLCHAADLPLIHRDPFDRVIIATAQRWNLTILTSDRVIPTYPGVQTIW